jgi:folate-binding protein YgfZ
MSTQPTIMKDLQFYPLEHLAITGITGSDTLNFLQGQGTQDYLQLSQRPAMPGAFCNAKGRVVANVWNVLLQQEPADIKLISHVSSAPLLQSHLKKYIPFFRGSRLTDDRMAYHGLGVSGAAVDEWLNASLGSGHAGVWQQNGHFAFVLPDGRAQYWLLATADDYENRLAAIEQEKVHPCEHWQRLDIEAGYPWVDEHHHLSFVPQMLNLDELDGISFKKGCYTGQEVVARLHYKGQSKRTLFSLSWDNEARPERPNLYSETGSAGEWVNWVKTGDRGAGLAVMKSSDVTKVLFLDEDRRYPLKLLQS